VIKAEAYNEVADWLAEMAAKMQKQSEATVFSERPERAVLIADDVRKMARQLRDRAKKVSAGAGK
jgi:hypothetical protein